MNDAMQIFNSSEFGQVRTIGIGNESFFIGKDVANILGYQNPNEAIQDHVDSEDKFIRSSRGREMLKLFSSVKEMQAVLGRQDNWFINESGVYSLIFGSKLPSAKRFKRWVTTDVLPSIRKHGGYLTPETVEKALLDPDTIIRLATNLKAERAAREAAERQIAADRHKVIFADSVSTAKTDILIGDLAKLIKQNGVDIGQKRLFEWMRANGYLIKSSGSRNMPTQRAMDIKLFTVKEGTYMDGNGDNIITKTTKITPKGQIYQNVP